LATEKQFPENSMSEQDGEGRKGAARILDLKVAIERIRNAEADRKDVVVDMKQAAHARLELLAQDLAPVIADVPQDMDFFEFSLTDGENPRLWIDMTTFVRMGRDRRTYEMVRDTRLGRTLVLETDQRQKMAMAVTDYVAERIIERDQAMAGDRKLLRQAPEKATVAERGSSVKWKAVWLGLAVFAAGMLAGAVLMVAWALLGNPPRS
jgi:hypothetical protein